MPRARRLALPLTALALAGALAPAAGAQDPPAQPPADPPVPKAGRPGPLWATVNRCDPPSRPGALGVRVSMPSRGRRYAQWVRIAVEYWSADDGRWHPAAGADSGWMRAGRGLRTVQAGRTFDFDPPAAGHRLVLRGLASFQWRRGAKVARRASRRTLAGYASSHDPLLKVSLPMCTIAR